MDRYKVAIVDDDELSLDNLVFGLQKFENFHLEGTARNGVSGKKLIAKVRPDLLFLDVELPDMRGMDLLDSIRESLTWGMKVVFYTAYDKYMMSAIRQSAFDYLLKPFEDKDLELIISRFMERIELERKAAFFPAALWCLLRQMTCGHYGLPKLDISGIALNGNSGRRC